MAGMTVDQAIERFLQHIEVEKGAAAPTVDLYRRYLDRFSQWLADTAPGAGPEDIDLELVRRYRLYLSRFEGPDGSTLKRATQGYYVIGLRALLRYLVVQCDVDTLPPEKIDLPKSKSRSVSFLNTEQIERLLNSPDTSDAAGLRDRAILGTLFSTGLRVSELARLNRDQVDLERKEFGVIGKGSKPRVVFLSDEAADWIRRYLDTREDNFKPLFIRHDPGVAGAEVVEGDVIIRRLTSKEIDSIVAKYMRSCRLSVNAEPLDRDQIESLFKKLRVSKFDGLRDRAILEMRFSGKLEATDLSRLDREHVGLDCRQIGVIGEGRSLRTVPLPDRSAECVRRYLEARKDDFEPLFIQALDMRLTPRSIQMMVSRHSQMCGLPVKATPHTLRHSFATDLLRAGADIRSVQEMLGHESIRTTQVYTHVTDPQLREVHRAFHGRKKPDETMLGDE